MNAQHLYFFISGTQFYILMASLGFMLAAIAFSQYRAHNQKKKRILLSKTRIKEKPMYYRMKESHFPDINLYREFLLRRKNIPKYTHSTYFSQPINLSRDEVCKRIKFYIDDLGLDTAHEKQDYFVYNLKKLLSVIAYYDYNDVELKQMFLDRGWSFHTVNSAFQEIEAELYSLINESFLIFPNDNIYTLIKKVKIIAADGYTLKQIYAVLDNVGYSEDIIKRVQNIIRLTQEANNEALSMQSQNIISRLQRNCSFNPAFDLNILTNKA